MTSEHLSDKSDCPGGQLGPKTHPAQREWLPDDPMSMHAVSAPGNPHVMLAIVVEEFLHMGTSPEEIVQMARSGNYQALGGLYRTLGEAEFAAQVRAIAKRIGTPAIRCWEAPPETSAAQPVPLQIQWNPDAPSRPCDVSGTPCDDEIPETAQKETD